MYYYKGNGFYTSSEYELFDDGLIQIKQEEYDGLFGSDHQNRSPTEKENFVFSQLRCIIEKSINDI